MGEISKQERLLLNVCKNLSDSIGSAHIDKRIKLKSEINTIIKTI